METVKELVESGMSVSKIAARCGISKESVKHEILTNRYQLINETFDDSKIERIVYLYDIGISAKQLGIKFSIDKRRIQRWVSSWGLLRDVCKSKRVTELNEHIMDVIDTPEKAYWLGFFYADAYNGDKVNTVTVSLNGKDEYHLHKLADFFGLPKAKVVRKTTNQNNDVVTLKIYSKHLCSTLTKLGCPRAKSLIITYPEFLSETLQSHFIRGLFDGDGCLTKRLSNNEWKFSLVSTSECLKSIASIFIKTPGITYYFHNISKTDTNTYELEVNGNQQVCTLMNWLYVDSDECCRLDRKYDKYQELVYQQNSRQERYKAS